MNNTPISHAVHLGAERIYVLPIEDPAYRPAHYAPRTALYRAICGLRLVIQTRLEADIARYSPEVELTVMPAPNLGQVPPTSLMMDARFAARTVVAREDAGRHSGWRGEDRLGVRLRRATATWWRMSSRRTPKYGGSRDPIHENRVTLGVSCSRGWE